jgi:hypothetical protein
MDETMGESLDCDGKTLILCIEPKHLPCNRPSNSRITVWSGHGWHIGKHNFTTASSVPVQSTTIYPLRNGSDLIIPFCRLSITTESFIPSTVKLGNRLDQFDRNLDTLTKFKKAIRKEQSDNTKRIPENLILFLLNFVTRIPF